MQEGVDYDGGKYLQTISVIIIILTNAKRLISDYIWRFIACVLRRRRH